MHQSCKWLKTKGKRTFSCQCCWIDILAWLLNPFSSPASAPRSIWATCGEFLCSLKACTANWRSPGHGDRKAGVTALGWRHECEWPACPWLSCTHSVCVGTSFAFALKRHLGVVRENRHERGHKQEEKIFPAFHTQLDKRPPLWSEEEGKSGRENNLKKLRNRSLPLARRECEEAGKGSKRCAHVILGIWE